MRLPVSPRDRSENRHPASFCGPKSAGRAGPDKLRFHTIEQVAEILCLSTRSVRRLIDDRKLSVHRFGHSVRIADADLRAFIAVHRIS